MIKKLTKNIYNIYYKIILIHVSFNLYIYKLFLYIEQYKIKIFIYKA